MQDSHIIPEFLYKPLYDHKHRAQYISRIGGQQQGYTKRKTLQKGLREKLLCFECEQLLNDRYEKYFKRRWFDEKALPRKLDNDSNVRLVGLDYAKFKLFHLSVLFRAGVSSLPEFEQVNLGPHEEHLRCVVLNDSPGSDKKYAILCHALTKNAHEIQYGLITSPFRMRQPSGHTSYGFCFGGCVWYYIVDGREVEKFSSFMLTSKGELSIMSMPWEAFLKL